MPNPDSLPMHIPGDLDLVGRQLGASALQLEGELDHLRRQLAPVIDTWRGSAGDGFAVDKANWDTASDDLFGPNGVLGAIAAAMHVNWNNYADCENHNSAGWGG